MASTTLAPSLPRALRRQLRRTRVWRPWLIAWGGGSVLGIANGAARELIYRDRVGEFRANQTAVASLIALLAAYFWALDRRWPIPTRALAFQIGAAWVALTVSFEFFFGHWVDRKSWSELASNYDIVDGRLWLLVLIWIGVGPAVVRRVRRHQGG